VTNELDDTYVYQQSNPGVSCIVINSLTSGKNHAPSVSSANEPGVARKEIRYRKIDTFNKMWTFRLAIAGFPALIGCSFRRKTTDTTKHTGADHMASL